MRDGDFYIDVRLEGEGGQHQLILTASEAGTCNERDNAGVCAHICVDQEGVTHHLWTARSVANVQRRFPAIGRWSHIERSVEET